MTFEDFQKELRVLISEKVENDPYFRKKILLDEMAELSWQAFRRVLVKQGLAVLPDDPIRPSIEEENG